MRRRLISSLIDFRKDWQRRVRVHFDQVRKSSTQLACSLSDLDPTAWSKATPPQCPSGKGRRRRSWSRRQAPSHCSLPHHQIQPPRPSRARFHPLGTKGTISCLSRPVSSLISNAPIKEAGIPRKLAPTIGISVDRRRQNLSEESLTDNVARLKAYRARLILFPRRVGQHKTGDSSKEEVRAAEKGEGKHVHRTHHALPLEQRAEHFSEVKTSEMPEGEEHAYRRLREARSEQRLRGVREKRVKAKAEEASAAKK